MAEKETKINEKTAMKWFKHETNAHTNLKHQGAISEFGAAAYGYYWACVELVGQDENFRIPESKKWKKYLAKFLEIDIETQEKFLKYFSDNDLIDREAYYSLGDLYIPKLSERADEYTSTKKRLGRVSGDNRDVVVLEESRTEEIKTNKKRIKKIRPSLTIESIKLEPLWPEILRKFPYRDYEFELKKMFVWYDKNKGRPPKEATAFANWLKKVPEDESMRAEALRVDGAAETKRRIEEMSGKPRASPEQVAQFREKMSSIGKKI